MVNLMFDDNHNTRPISKRFTLKEKRNAVKGISSLQNSLNEQRCSMYNDGLVYSGFRQLAVCSFQRAVVV